MKKCSTCKQEKSFELFSKNKSQKDGYSNRCKVCVKEFYINNKSKILCKNKEYYEKNKETIINHIIKYKLINKEIIKKQSKEYYEKNKEKIKNYRENNKENARKYQNEYCIKRKKTDNIFRLSCAIRSNICGSFKRGTNQFRKDARTEKILGCTIEEFIIYISNKFEKGMSLDNYGKWHLDHIHPVSLAKTEEEILRLNHYTNFQPLWAIDNIIKSNKI
jgi:hypothetical protein